MLNLTVKIEENNTQIAIPAHQLQMMITSDCAVANLKEDGLCLIFDDRKLVTITTLPLSKTKKSQTMIIISMNDNTLKLDHLKFGLVKLAGKNEKTPQIPVEFEAAVTKKVQVIALILAQFGYKLKSPMPKKAGKPRHKWTKEISTLPFYLDYHGATATVFWQKRSEIVIKSGAKLQTEIPLNKDGSVGFSARFAQKLRAEHENEITGKQTVADVVLKSPNEVGLFLYFGGTNSWLQLKDEDGRTLDSWSQVE